MIVCVCNAVTSAEVDRSIDEGATTVEQVTRACGAGGCCGACHETIEQMIDAKAIVSAERLRRGREAA